MSQKKINVVFILPNLLPGGAERVFSYISQNLNKNIFNVTLLIIGYEKDASYDISNINLIYLNKPRVSKAILPIVTTIRQLNPKIVISANGHLNTLMAYISFLFPKIKFISREVTLQTLMTETFHNKKSLFNLKSFLARNRYRFLDKVICQSADMLNDIKEKYNVRTNKLVVINNPITDNFKFIPRDKTTNTLKLITVGRLSKEKGHHRVLNLLSRLEISFHYTIIGDGPEKERVLKTIKDLNLSSNITYIEFTKEVSKYLSSSDLFLQGSFYEGFPNALLESCAVGTPVIAFNVPGGTKEIIQNGINGYMVDSENEYLNKIQSYSKLNPEMVSQSVLKKFNKTIILKKYEDLFKNILKN